MNYRRLSPLSDVICAENLSALGRRGLLVAAQMRRLEIALAGSEALRCSHQLGRDFDDLHTACDDDAALLARLARRARERYERPNAVRKQSFVDRALPWVGMVSLLLVSAAAGASLWPHVAVPSAVKQETAKSRAIAPPVANGGRALPRVMVPSVPSHDTSNVVGKALGAKPDAVTEPPRSAASVTATTRPISRIDLEEATVHRLPQPAAALFSDANSARRRGDVEGARFLYQRLRETYPAANETALSYVLMARIDLANRSAQAALRQFNQYLSLAPTGPLAEEAIEGRAAACRQLGMPAEEALAWRELLRLYPDSVYARAARKRLDELQ